MNGATRSTSDIGKLAHDLQCRDAEEMYFDVLKKRVSEFKKSKERMHDMCEVLERIEARGRTRPRFFFRGQADRCDYGTERETSRR